MIDLHVVYQRHAADLRRFALYLTGKPAQADVAASIELRLEQREQLAHVRATLASLAEVDRSALLLRALHDMPYEEIARVLDISLAAAKVKVHRARLRLAAVAGEKVLS